MTHPQRGFRVPVVILALGLVALPAQSVVAQGRAGGPQVQLLRDAARLESEGDLEGAELALRSLLEASPTSAGGLFALERVLRAKGEVSELSPLVDAFLAREPDAEVRGLKLRLLGEAGALDDLVAESDRWIAEDPSDPGPYREVARAYQAAFGAERAVDVLRRGRSAIGGGALALELGDLLAESGDLDGAVSEWASAVEPNGTGAQTVRRRVQSLPSGADDAGRMLVQRLGDSVEPRRVGAAARIALELGLGPEARALAERYAADLEGRARGSFLEDVATLATEADLASVAAWAYDALRSDASGPGEARQLDLRVVESALTAGDTVAALAAQRRVAESYPPGSDEAREAAARVVRLEAVSAGADELRLSFLEFQAEHPAAPELDGLAAAVAAKLQAMGDGDGAVAVLAGIEGPRSTLEAAYLRLEAGDLEGGRTRLLVAVGGLPPSEATPIIQLAGLLARLSDPGAVALVDAHVSARRGDGEGGARSLVQRVAELAASDAAPLLAEAARMADGSGASELAVTIRERIVAEHGDAAEAAEATLGLARHHAGPGSDPAEAVRLLEELIVAQPNAAIVPEARLELERLRSRGP